MTGHRNIPVYTVMTALHVSVTVRRMFSVGPAPVLSDNRCVASAAAPFPPPLSGVVRGATHGGRASIITIAVNRSRFTEAHYSALCRFVKKNSVISPAFPHCPPFLPLRGPSRPQLTRPPSRLEKIKRIWIFLAPLPCGKRWDDGKIRTANRTTGGERSVFPIQRQGRFFSIATEPAPAETNGTESTTKQKDGGRRP